MDEALLSACGPCACGCADEEGPSLRKCERMSEPSGFDKSVKSDRRIVTCEEYGLGA